MSQKLKIAVVEDEAPARVALELLLQGHETAFWSDAASFADDSKARTASWDLVLLDLRNALDPAGKISLSRIPEIRRLFPRAEVVVQSGSDEVPLMRACVRQGAARFVLKEHLGIELPPLLARLSESRLLRDEVDAFMPGESPLMDRLKRELLALRFENTDVLVEGESGSGKELCARALHAEGSWIAVNVSAVPADLFESEFFGAERGAYTGANQVRVGHCESAGSGTLFLDEIQSLSLALQAKLLRVLETRTFMRVGSSQERPFKARIVAAANRPLRELAAQGLFREDLYYRLASVAVRVPPLRTRGRDIAALAQRFVKEFDTQGTHTLMPAALDYLSSGYDWPGNVRELRNLVRSLMLKSRMPRVDVAEVKEALGRESDAWTPAGASSEGGGGDFRTDWSRGFDDNVANFEKFLLAEVLREHRGQEAREKLKMSRSRFYEKLRQYGLKNDDQS